MSIFESCDAFRAHCGEPTMPLEQCPICSKVPQRCSREVEDYDVSDDRPVEALRLERFVEGRSNGDRSGEILRCPTCHRLYLSVTIFGLAYGDYSASWERYPVDELFNVGWCVEQRLPDHRVSLVLSGLFPDHALVRFEDSDTWHALDRSNQLVTLGDKDALARLIDRDPPRVTGDLDLARRYASFVDGIENPGDKRHALFRSIAWKEPLTRDEQRQVDAARAASRIEEAVAEREGDRVLVRFWVTSQRRLICRVITVQPDGQYFRDDTVMAENLPFATKREPMFESLDAFRGRCGTPTMPLEQCPICSKIPERCLRTTGEEENEDNTVPELDLLVPLVDDEILSCPTCRRVYFHRSVHFGNTIYYGNCVHDSWDRYDVETLFDITWCIKRRLPDHGVAYTCSNRFFPGHALVNLGSKSWGAVDRDNRLVLLDSRPAIDNLIDLDPPRVTEDLELAKRYAIFFDELENPDDRRPGYWQFMGWRAPLTPEQQQHADDARAAAKLEDPSSDMQERAEHDGDRVIVRMWIASRRRLVCRVMTVQPNGHYIREDAVIAENLPIHD
jgi:hypothetical protein